ncbi:hypothetical protein M9Y10_005072 [Tritrichomonas musculus]|uniref:Uncharacterized protein n=1 Tax=Tritrichomonas musculus TaxID=1915356 RepID=A0ABR2JK75_9EUKA
MSAKTFSAEDWFEHYMGFAESYDSVTNNLYVEELKDHSELINKVTNKRYNCGRFLLRDISSYEYLFSKNESFRNNGHLNIIRGNGSRSSRFDLIDVLQHQNVDEFEGSTFLACSNFNCLEFPHANCNAKHGISNYAVDMTQGPILQTATLPCTIYRNYFVKHKKIQSITNDIKYDESIANYFIDINSDSNVYYQSNEQVDNTYVYQGQVDYELNLLERTPIPVRHGKAVLDRDNQNITNNKLFKNFDFTNENAYLIGVHQNCQVTTNREYNWTYIDTLDQNKIVHQVFASTLSLGGYATKNEENIKIMNNILINEYKLTILAAWENSLQYPNHPGSNKCVLSLLGSGSFSNPIPAVASAIIANKDLIIKSGLDVYIICFIDDIFNKVDEVVHGVVLETGGKIIDAR